LETLPVDKCTFNERIPRFRDIKPQINPRGAPVAKPNYSFEKRQKELAKKRKKEEKRQKKAGTPDKPQQENSSKLV
jgi:hypothetical protein